MDYEQTKVVSIEYVSTFRETVDCCANLRVESCVLLGCDLSEHECATHSLASSVGLTCRAVDRRYKYVVLAR